MRRPRRRAATLVAAVAVAFGASAIPSATGAHAAPTPTSPPTFDVEQAESQAAALATEDRRITEVRTVTALNRWQDRNWKTPYRLGTAAGYTLVLTPRSDPYTVDDLLSLAPQTFLAMSDGSYLLTEHVVVTPRATLRLTAPGGLTLRLMSGHEGFATIVSFGGTIELLGESGAEVELTSWDTGSGTVDTHVSDGRAYIRAIGGQFTARHVVASHLGFWSGRTGGIAVTGTDRPNTGAITTVDELRQQGIPSILDDVSIEPAGAIDDPASVPGLDGFDYSVPSLTYVSATMEHLIVRESAFGLFVSGANGVQITDSEFTDNHLGGVVFHRYVTNGIVQRSASLRNAGDGFSVDRATTGITISESTASDNLESGFRLSGRPLAEGPSAVGASLRSYGNNAVTGSTATGNGRYGIEVLGGFNIGIQNNVVDGHDMGIMVNGPADRISVIGNTVTDADRHAIALVNGVADATVTGNLVDGVATGIYLRDSVALVKGNTVEAARLHGVTLAGEVGGTEVSYNVLAGSGPSAVDAMRSAGDVAIGSNTVDTWRDTTPWYHVFRQLLRPMTLLWAFIGLLILVSAIRGRTHRPLVHPYAHQMAHHGIVPIPRPLHDVHGDDRHGLETA